MSSVSLALIVPGAIVVSGLYVACDWVVRRAVVRYRSAACDGVFPGSPAHRHALDKVAARTAPAFTGWHQLTTAQQAAADQQALDQAAAIATPLPALHHRGESP